MKRLFIRGFLLLSLAVAAAVWWLFYENRPPSDGIFPLDIAALRKEATTLPGAGPQRIEVETLYSSGVPKIAMIAGTNWSEMGLVRNSYRLVWPERSAIIDTGNDEVTARQDRWTKDYDRAAWARMQNALDEAALILVTHEHLDHIGGLLQGPKWRTLLPKAQLNSEQVAFSDQDQYWTSNWRAGYKSFDYQGIKAVAPGVVLIRAPGHTRGSQMIYVRRADGRELIFMGDTASSLDNVRLIRPRSRYVMTSGSHGDDREAVFRQTIALSKLLKTVSGLMLVPGHDAAAIRDIEKAGLLTRNFTPAP